MVPIITTTTILITSSTMLHNIVKSRCDGCSFLSLILTLNLVGLSIWHWEKTLTWLKHRRRIAGGAPMGRLLSDKNTLDSIYF